MQKLVTDQSYMQFDECGLQFDFDDNVSVKSNNTRLIKNKSMIDFIENKTLSKSGTQLEKKEE